jgi:rhamnosyltransferase
MYKSKIVISIILYKPSKDIWFRIRQSIGKKYVVFIFDNSPLATKCPIDILSSPDVHYFTFGLNVGIGLAIKQMCATAYYEHIKYLVYFDQDTVFTSDTLDYISEFVSLVEGEEGKTNKRIERISSITFRDQKKSSCSDTFEFSGRTMQIVDFTINSGSLFFLERLKEIGWHNSKYFIDGVDYSYCLEAAAAGYYIAEINGVPGLNHSIEQGDCLHKFLGCSFVGRRYPLYRRKDFLFSSNKLIFRAMRVDARKVLWLTRSLVLYFVIQMIIPFSHDVSRKE